MTDFVRRLVSGDKSRLRDEKLDLDLDLAYVTDQVIVMGYPASGIESLYRNRREDAKRFLEHRHGKNFWVFNFCPVNENTYPSSVVDGRVSRYPFPDHHAPPLAIMPLIAREIRAWLEGSPERVVVLHCKAGKGRSGTMACAYLITSIDDASSSDFGSRSATEKEKATVRAERIMDAMPSDEPSDDGPDDLLTQTTSVATELDARVAESVNQTQSGGEGIRSDRLDHILELHTSRRMKRPSSPTKKLKQGVSIPSQRRWLYYWSLLIAHEGPPRFWAGDPQVPPSKMRLTQIVVRMRELSGIKTNIVRAANALIERTSYAKGAAQSRGQIWASLARYDDELVNTLEGWERHTRDEAGDMGKRRLGSERMNDERLANMFKDDRWDKNKMVRTFARFGVAGDDTRKGDTSSGGSEISTTRMLTLRPLTDNEGSAMRDARGTAADNRRETIRQKTTAGEASISDAGLQTPRHDTDAGVVLHADREVRVKLYMGQVFMGWFWFIPTFHLPHPRGQAGQAGQGSGITLTRKELDFPVGIGKNILDVSVSLEWVPEDARVPNPPPVSAEAGDREPVGLVPSLAAAPRDDAKVVETKRTAEG